MQLTVPHVLHSFPIIVYELTMFLKGSNSASLEDYALLIFILLFNIVTFYFSVGPIPTAREHAIIIFQLTK